MVTQLPKYGTKAQFVELIIEGTTPTTPTTQSNATNWANNLKVPFTTGIDSDPSTFTIEKTYGPKETTYIVDRATRKILVKAADPVSGLSKLDALP